MANLIITVIAIALVAIASLMGAYYGGSAFLNNQSAANASTVLNQAQQVAGAWNAYLSDNMNSPPTNVSQLITQGYLAQMPTSPAASGYTGYQGNTSTGIFIGNSNGHYIANAIVGYPPGGNKGPFNDPAAAACLRIIKTAIGSAKYADLVAGNDIPQQNSGGIASDTSGTMSNGTFGCAYNSAGSGNNNPIGGSSPVPFGVYLFEYILQ